MNTRIMLLILSIIMLIVFFQPVMAESIADNNIFDITDGNITISAGTDLNTVKVAYVKNGPQVKNNISNTQEITLIGTTTAYKVVVDGVQAKVKLNKVDIQTAASYTCAFEMKNGANVTLDLNEINILKSSSNPGLKVSEGTALTIKGNGSLTATGDSYAAGIGGANSYSCGAITIENGNVTAIGGKNGGSGIGGGKNGAGGNITINGGTVIATGLSNASGIGGGGTNISSGIATGIGNIIINGGTVTAKGNGYGAGIGGCLYSSDGRITISGGTITATGGDSAAGIGGGSRGAVGSVTIENGNVTAIGGIFGGAGIGGGESGEGGVIKIKNSDVTATGGSYAAGIGGGGSGSYAGGTGGTITIENSTVTSKGGDGGAGIGGGTGKFGGGAGGLMNLNGGTIYATGGRFGAAGIGGGGTLFQPYAGGAGGTITIEGGVVNATALMFGAGIGGGQCSQGGLIVIKNGNIIATGGNCGAGIGGGGYITGSGGAGGTITIENGTVSATGGEGGAGIGGGKEGAGGIITINDPATVTAFSSGIVRPAIHAANDSLETASTASVMMTNFETKQSKNILIDILLKSSSGLYKSFSSTVDYQSIAYTVPEATYLVKLANTFQQHGSAPVISANFGISQQGLTIFNHVFPTYNINIGTISGGKITANPAATGEIVDLIITPDLGNQLKNATLKYNDGTQDVTIIGTQFVMPAANVTVSAEFEAILNQDQLAPNALLGVAPTSLGGNNGEITGATTAMEYKLSTDNIWTVVTGTGIDTNTKIVGLVAGSYHVRYAAKAGYNAGTTAIITVPVFIAPTVDAMISPTLVSFDLNKPADITTIITWNSAQMVTGVFYGGVQLSSMTDYTISGGTFIIKKEYLAGLNLSKGDTAEFAITFSAGKNSKLTVEAVESYIPSSNAVLGGLNVGGNPVSGFSGGKYEYDVVLPHGTLVGSAAVTVEATLTNHKASKIITQAPNLPGSATVMVTSEDTTSTLIYTIRFTLKVVSNTLPTAKVLVPTQKVSTGSAITFTAVQISQDADGDPLSIQTIKTGPDLITASATLDNGIVTITGVKAGNTAMIVTVSDGKGTVDVTVPIVVTELQVPTYVLTMTAGSGGSVIVGSSGNYVAGNIITINAVPASGYSFGKWISTRGSFSNENSARTTFIMPSETATITANFILNTSSGGNNNSGGSGSTRSVVNNTPDFVQTNKALVSGMGPSGTEIPIYVNSYSGNAIVEPGTQNGVVFTGKKTSVITVPPIKGVKSYTLGIPAVTLSDPIGKGKLTLSTDAGNITIPDNMLSSISGTDGKKVGITIEKANKSLLNDEAKAAIGDRPLIQLTLTLDGQKVEWNNRNAPVIVSIAYTPTAVEKADPEHIVVWYIDSSGKVISVPSGRYDPATGRVTFTTTHFSYYAIAYVNKTFNDLNRVEWARKPIEVMASKGIINGVGKDTYSPTTNITRGEYLLMLIRTLELTANTDGNFEDVPQDTYYYEAIGIAKKLGITAGSGNNKFNPNDDISRQDMLVLTAHALEKFKGFKTTSDSNVLNKFSDKGDIAGYALESLKSMVDEGLISGSGSKLRPNALTSRAEATVLLYKIYSR